MNSFDVQCSCVLFQCGATQLNVESRSYWEAFLQLQTGLSLSQSGLKPTWIEMGRTRWSQIPVIIYLAHKNGLNKEPWVLWYCTVTQWHRYLYLVTDHGNCIWILSCGDVVHHTDVSICMCIYVYLYIGMRVCTFSNIDMTKFLPLKSIRCSLSMSKNCWNTLWE